MNQESASNPPDPAAGTDTSADQALDLAKRSLDAAMNLQWDLSGQLKQQAEAMAATIEGKAGELIGGLIACIIDITEGFAIPLRDTDTERNQRALDVLAAARDRVESLRRSYPEETDLPSFKELADSMEMQSLWTSLSLARQQGDEQRLRTIEAQTRVLVENLPAETRAVFVALLEFPRLMGQVKESTEALNSMDLSRALRLLTEIRATASDQLDTIRQNLLNNVIFQASEQVMTAAFQLCEAIEAYVRALHDAVVGDVTRAHVEQLKEAEHLLPSIIERMVSGMAILGRSDDAAANELRTSLEHTTTLIRNLRNLCQESLKPKSWVATASFKFVVVFLGTSIPLVALLAATNVGDGISGGALTAYVLLVSFVVGLVGGFGFEALRFTPLLSVLSKSMPSQGASTGGST